MLYFQILFLWIFFISKNSDLIKILLKYILNFIFYSCIDLGRIFWNEKYSDYREAGMEVGECIRRKEEKVQNLFLNFFRIHEFKCLYSFTAI